MNPNPPIPTHPSMFESEKRLELFIDAVTDYAIYMLDPEGFVMTWNRGAQRLKGYTAAEVIGKHFSIFYPPEESNSDKPVRELRTAIESGRFEEENWRIRKDGSRFWANVVLTPVYDTPHKLIGFTKVTRDFTERRKFEEDLRQSEERFRLMVQTVKDYAIFMLDDKGFVSSWNEGAQRAKGYSASEIIGRHFGCFYTPEDTASGLPEELLRIAAKVGRVEVEGWRVRKDGTRFWADVTLTAIRDPSGALRGYAKVTRDITERRAAEESLRGKQAEINQLQKMEALGHLAGGIAHDFNNLLAGILGCAEAAGPAISDPEALDDIHEIEKACERGRLLVQQLMAFSRRQIAAPKVLKLNAVIDDMKQLLHRSVGAGIELKFDLASDLSSIKMDISQIEQVIMNLILNARDAMPSGGQLLIKTANTWIDEFSVLDGLPRRPCHTVALTVDDSGIGMSSDVVAKIFEPFFTTKPIGKGTGLGLSTVYGIIQQNHGGLSVYSNPGMGTSFKLFLPVYESMGEPGGLKPGDDPKTAADLRGTELVLVVEDEPLVLRNTVRALQAKGYSVLFTDNPETAEEIFKKTGGKVQLLLTDIIMPGKNGKDLADTLRQSDPHLKVLFMSGYPAETIADHGIIHGAVDLLEKPFNVLTLARKVRDVLDRPA